MAAGVTEPIIPSIFTNVALPSESIFETSTPPLSANEILFAAAASPSFTVISLPAATVIAIAAAEV